MTLLEERPSDVPQPVASVPVDEADGHRTEQAAAAIPARPAPVEPPKPKRLRLAGLDVARGLAIVLMLLVMNPGPTSALPGGLHHATWNGFTLADLAFPLFLFAAGVSMTLSSRGLDTGNVLRRCAILFVLGVALTTFKNESLGIAGVLQHTAGAYLVAFAVLRAPRRWQLPLGAAILGTIGLAFAVHGWGGDPWAQSDTLAHAVDGALLGGFTAEGTLQTITSGVTVLGGGFAGRWIRESENRDRLIGLLSRRAVGLTALGLALAVVVPINKRLWTPSYTVFTIGLSLAVLAVATWLVDGRGLRRIASPLVHLGTNPIAVYAGFMLLLAAFRNYGENLTPEVDILGSPMIGSLAYAFAWVAVWWLVARTMYRRGIFVKV